jgi:hypothetical protein
LRTAWETKTAEEFAVRLLFIALVLLTLLSLIVYIFRKPRDSAKAALRRERASLLVTASCVALYFVLLALATILTDQHFSGSYFPESAADFLGGVFVPTLIAFIPTGILLIGLLTYANRGRQTTVGLIRWAAVTLIAVAAVYVSAMAFFITRNGPGLPWYAPDVAEPITYFYIVVSNMAFCIFSLVAFLGGLGVAKLLAHRHVGS